MEKILTVCPYCGCGCGLYLHAEGGRITGVSPSRHHPVNQGSLCVKGWNAHEFVQHPDRLTHPLIRHNGRLTKATWPDAFTFIADRLTSIRQEHGPDALGFLSSAKCTNEENYLMMKFARAVIGTNNIDHCARLCHSSTVGGLAAAFGSGAMTNSISEIKDAKVLFIIGSNTTEQHPMIAMHMLKAKDSGASLIVADPRKTQIASMAKLHLRHRCGTDVALLLGIMNSIITDGLVDLNFVRKRTENFDQFQNTVSKYPPSVSSAITGVPQADIKRAARIYATEKRSMLFYSMGITQHTTGVDNVRACADLVMLTGHIGLPMTGLNPLRGQNNVQGSCDMGALPNVYSGYQQVADSSSRQKFERAWRTKLPTEPGLTLMEMIGSSSIKGLCIMGENPLISDPDTGHVAEFFEKLEFLAVWDIFLSETARYAHVVLPAASYAEKEGTYTNTDRRVQMLRRAMPPVGESMPDWKILCELSMRMGYNLCYRGPYEIMEEIALLTPSYGGILHHRLDEGYGIQWPCADNQSAGTPYLHRKKFAKGLGSFMTVDHKEPAETPDSQYPYILTTGRLYFQYHTGTMTRRTLTLEREAPECTLEINPADAHKLNIRDGSNVSVTSRRGRTNVKSKITDKTPEGTVFMPFHYGEASANLLTNPALDPEAKIPEFKVCAVKIEAL